MCHKEMHAPCGALLAADARAKILIYWLEQVWRGSNTKDPASDNTGPQTQHLHVQKRGEPVSEGSPAHGAHVVRASPENADCMSSLPSGIREFKGRGE